MSFFTEDIDNIRSQTEFNSFVTDTTAYQSSQDYTDYQNQQAIIKSAELKQHISKIIVKHFNAEDKNTFNPSITSITIYVGNLIQSDRDCLETVLTNKGYTVNIDNATLKMTISG